MTAKVQYATGGALFGFLFPLLSTIYLSYYYDVSFLDAQLRPYDGLIWVVDTAPFFLGLFGYWVGVRQDLLSSANLKLVTEISVREKIWQIARLSLAKHVANTGRERLDVFMSYELFSEVALAFLSSCSESVLQLKKALHERNYQGVEHYSHKLRGAILNFQEGELTQILKKIEQDAGVFNLETCQANLERVDILLNDLKNKIENLLSSHELDSAQAQDKKVA